jgi:hypothetical protein
MDFVEDSRIVRRTSGPSRVGGPKKNTETDRRAVRGRCRERNNAKQAMLEQNRKRRYGRRQGQGRRSTSIQAQPAPQNLGRLEVGVGSMATVGWAFSGEGGTRLHGCVGIRTASRRHAIKSDGGSSRMRSLRSVKGHTRLPLSNLQLHLFPLQAEVSDFHHEKMSSVEVLAIAQKHAHHLNPSDRGGIRSLCANTGHQFDEAMI